LKDYWLLSIAFFFRGVREGFHVTVPDWWQFVSAAEQSASAYWSVSLCGTNCKQVCNCNCRTETFI